ncbi:hypothetical protein NQ315_016185 [Exocentrus adspersus]|uniref:Uncharacterized protein n=1 Tax=Exocentrus adspersus TaxID=1586481 RepID=A0AAV8V7Q9_9CUCU|nr:hypothetical protein NQ315_016185 [Exocentrus adspersus]
MTYILPFGNIAVSFEISRSEINIIKSEIELGNPTPCQNQIPSRIPLIKMALLAAMVLSGLPCEQFEEDIHRAYNYGHILLSSPSSLSVTSTASDQSSDRGISPDSLIECVDRYMDIISNLEVQLFIKKRNILDLAEHLTSDWIFQYAVLKLNFTDFFGKQISVFSNKG